MGNITKKQHYVSKFYLKKWLSFRVNNKKEGIWVNNKIRKDFYFCTDLNSISQEKYFYEINLDQDVYDLLLSKYKEPYKIVDNELDEMKILLAISNYEKKGMKLIEEMDQLKKVYLEKKYSKIEGEISIVLNQLSDDYENFIEDMIKNKIDLSIFVITLITQFYRTNKMRAFLISHFKKLTLIRGNDTTQLTNEQKKSFIKAMVFVDSIIAVKDLLKKDYLIELYVNNSDIDYITSSSPVTLIHQNKIKDLSSFKGFMALSPTVVLVVNGNSFGGNNFKVFHADYNKVQYFNKLTYQNSDGDIYSSVKFTRLSRQIFTNY